MRLLKVRIRRGDPAKGENQMVYPARYDTVEVDRFGRYATALNPSQVSLSGDIGRGGDEEFCIIALPDALAQEYALDPDMMIIDGTTTDSLMESWRVNNGAPEEAVTDETRLMAIRAKQEAKTPLSQEDLDALDATKPVKGISKMRTPVRDKITVEDADLATLPKNLKEMQSV